MEEPLRVSVCHEADVAEAGRAAAALAATLGFSETIGEELRLAARELASNLVRHARGGVVNLSPCGSGLTRGLEIEALDEGPGIPDPDRALLDGFSTADGLGYGLGAVDRAADELEIGSPLASGRGTRVVLRRFLRAPSTSGPGPVVFGASTRPRPGQRENGDAFVLSTWSGGALAAVIDGLGHGRFAHLASSRARAALLEKPDRPLLQLFADVVRACRPTRGVVMTLARFDPGRLQWAGIGNVEARLLGGPKDERLLARRGVLGGRAPGPLVQTLPWSADRVLVVHSDGLSSRWSPGDFPGLWQEPPQVTAGKLLRGLRAARDDATVVVAKPRPS